MVEHLNGSQESFVLDNTEKTHHLIEHLGRANLHQVQPDADDDDFEMRGRSAFGDLTFRQLSSAARKGGFSVGRASELGEDEIPLIGVADGAKPSLLDRAPSNGDDMVLAVTRHVAHQRRSSDDAGQSP